MRLLRAIARRAGVSVMTIGLAAAGTVAISSPSHAADEVTVIVRVIVNVPLSQPSVGVQTATDRHCYRDFVLGQARELSVTTRKGWQARIYPSAGCYTFLVVPSQAITAEYDGQVFDVTLGDTAPAPHRA